MKIAAIYDIHGNLPALEAVLNDTARSGVDQIVVGGDVILRPMSRECMGKLLSIEIPVQFIKGNCEVAAFWKTWSLLLHLDSKADFRYVNYDIEKAVDRI